MCIFFELFSQFDATAEYDDGKYDATTYDGTIWNGNANAHATVHANDATSDDATSAIVSCRRRCINCWSTSNATKANISGLQVKHFGRAIFWNLFPI